MIVELSDAQLKAIASYVASSEDAEALGSDEYTLDLFDLEPPLSLEFALRENGIDVMALCELAFDEEWDGWYIKERLLDEREIRGALLRWPLLRG